MGARRIIEAAGKGRGAAEPPLLCAPLVGRTRQALLAEAAAVMARRPDLVEWRVDFFEGIGRPGEVVALGRELRALAGETAILFTRRSTREGGEPIPIGEAEVASLCAQVCRAGWCDYVDQELSSAPADLAAVREAARQAGVGLVASFHDFQETPPAEVILAKLSQAQELGADVAKVAVMPRRLEDVLTLLGATLRARQELRIPLITMSMGALGSLSRLVGWVFGSAVTFGVGASSSAPGQVPLEELRAVAAALRRSLDPGR